MGLKSALSLAIPLSLISCSDNATVFKPAIVASAQHEIIGGYQANPDDFPSVVALLYPQSICTGILITPQWVLTAAHCIDPEVLQLPSQQAVTDDLEIVVGASDVSENGTVYAASVTIPHPNYSLNRLGDDDIGLVRLAKPVENPHFTPINRGEVQLGLFVRQAGYGVTQPGRQGQAGVLMALDSETVISCSPYELSNDTLLCFSQSGGRGKCGGDSGGPSFATINGVERVVGVTSFGDEDCVEVGADTRVDAELDFLFRHAPELQCQGDGDCNDDCDGDLLPVDPDCEVPEDCTQNGVCNPACGTNELPDDPDCEVPEDCTQNGVCNPACGTNELPDDPDCEVPEDCTQNGVCNPACGKNALPEDEDCPSCEGTKDCEDGQTCDPDSKTCIVAPKPVLADYGESCNNASECDSGQCASTADVSICTSECVDTSECPSGFSCEEAGATQVCWPTKTVDGSCSAGGRGGFSSLFLVFAAVFLGLRPKSRRVPTPLR